MTNSELVKQLADGKKVWEIAKDSGFSRRTLETRIIRLREQVNCSTVSHLVAEFLRRRIIE